MLRVKDWTEQYENNRTRCLRKLDWVPIPNRHDGFAFRSIMAEPDGEAIFGAWILILEVASKCEPRGMLRKGNGQAHTAESLAVMTGARASVMTRAIEVLKTSDVGWIEDIDEQDIIDFSPAEDKAESSKAHGRVNDALRPGKGVYTPEGVLTERPPHCQWCGSAPPQDGKGNTRIVGHHLTGYGTRAKDLTVIFVCRVCHGKMENNYITNQHIADRFGTAWIPQAGSAKGQCGRSAVQDGDARTALEGKGTEGKGTEEDRDHDDNTPPLTPEDRKQGRSVSQQTVSGKELEERLDNVRQLAYDFAVEFHHSLVPDDGMVLSLESALHGASVEDFRQFLLAQVDGGRFKWKGYAYLRAATDNYFGSIGRKRVITTDAAPSTSIQ